METTDKLGMLKQGLETMTDQMKEMVKALGTPRCFTVDETAQDYLNFQDAVRDISNKCQNIAWTAYECHAVIVRAPLEKVLAELHAEVRNNQ